MFISIRDTEHGEVIVDVSGDSYNNDTPESILEAYKKIKEGLGNANLQTG